MIGSPQPIYLSPEEYLAIEETSEIKHEYIQGEIYDLAGATDPHVTIAGNLFALLRSHVRGSGCRVYISDMKVRLKNSTRFYYPDIMVTCDSGDRETPNYKQFPSVIVEVLSDSTEAFDRGDKFADYQTIETLQEYILINTKRQRIESFQRSDEGLWILRAHLKLEDTLRIDSINFETTLALIYEDVFFNN